MATDSNEVETAQGDVPEWRAKLANKIIKEYDDKKTSNRELIEDEVRRIAYPLGTNDHESDTESYSQEDEMYDTTTREALTTAKNGTISKLLPHTYKWFGHRFIKKSDQDDEDRANRALEKLSDIQFKQLAQDNFYIAAAECLDDFFNFGTTNIMLKKGKRRFAHFKAVTKSKYRFALDDEGFADIVWVYYKLTAYEIKTMFGERGLPQKIADCVKDEKWDEKFEVINKITRRDDFDPRDSWKPTPNPEKREFESIWVSKADKDIIGNSTQPRRKIIYKDGLYFNPYTIGRLQSRAGQIEGEGITTMMLPAIRVANSKAKNIEKAENLAVDPPWYEDESNPIDDAILPGARIPMNSFDADSLARPVEMPIQGIQFEKMGLTEIRQMIKKAFFNEAFRMFTEMDVATNRKTATEARLMKSEQLAIVSTILYPFVEEIIKPLLEKHLNLMIQEGRIPQSVLDDLPDDYETELTSQFAKSIEGTQIEDLVTALELALQIEQVSPGTARSTVKWNNAFHRILLNLEIDVDDLYSLAESKEMMQKELDMQQQMMQAEVGLKQADAQSKIQA